MQTKAQTRAQAPQESQTNSLTRRNFLVLGLGALTTVAALETGVAEFMFLRSRSLEGEFGGVIKAGEIEKFPPGSVTEFPEDNFFLVHADDGGFLAVYQRCPHLGCTVNWNAEKSRFLCPVPRFVLRHVRQVHQPQPVSQGAGLLPGVDRQIKPSSASIHSRAPTAGKLLIRPS